MSMNEAAGLAINGGPKTRSKPFPGRNLIGIEEKDAVDALFDAAIASGNAIGYNGLAEEAYCREFAAYMGGGYADAVNSGTTAVFVALKALNLEPFTEVIVSPVTDPGGMMPIPLINCIPVVADAAPGQYNTGAAQIEEQITPLTSAIVVAHIGGEPCDMEPILQLAKKHSLPVVEDCAQAHGARLNGKLARSFGDIAAVSTMFGKHHCTGGQGGIVFTQREELYWRARQIADRGKAFGLPAGSTNVEASLNFNSNELSATIGRVQLRKLPGIAARRRQIVAALQQGFKDLQAISVPQITAGAEPSYWFWRLKVNAERLTCTKLEFCQAVQAEGISLNPSYRAALPFQMDWFKNHAAFGSSGYPWSAPEYKGDRNREFLCPNALTAVESQFNLELSESWGDEEIADIIQAFAKVERVFLK